MTIVGATRVVQGNDLRVDSLLVGSEDVSLFAVGVPCREKDRGAHARARVRQPGAVRGQVRQGLLCREWRRKHSLQRA
jgi:hypothetical protein